MSPTLAAWSLAATQSLTVFHEDVGSQDKGTQIGMIAESVRQAALDAKGWPLSRKALIAAELAMVDNETHASLRIHRNECNLQKGECDGGRAISLFQLHANALSSPAVWPALGFMTFESTLMSAREASRILTRSYLYCAAAKVPGDPIALMYTAAGGHGCQLDKWSGWVKRLASYERVMRVVAPSAPAVDSGKAGN